MCRFFALRSLVPARVDCALVRGSNSLAVQSQCDRQGKTNAHGWGVLCYDEIARLEPRPPSSLTRSTAAAHSDPQFSEIAAAARGRTVLAHVRNATVGGASMENTHPFVWRHWAFMHNGTAEGFSELRGRLVQETTPELQARVVGSTDSEQIFYWLLSRGQAAGLPVDRAGENAEKWAAVVARATSDLAGWSERAAPDVVSKLNFVLTDGVLLVATRWNQTLSYHAEPRACAVCADHHAVASQEEYRAVAVYSESTHDEHEIEVPPCGVFWTDADVAPHAEAI